MNMESTFEFKDVPVCNVLMDILNEGYAVLFYKNPIVDGMVIYMKDRNVHPAHYVTRIIDKASLERANFPDLALKLELHEMKDKMNKYRKSMEKEN